MDLTDIHRVLHTATTQYTFFSAAHGTFSKIDHILGHKASLNKYKKTEISPCIKLLMKLGIEGMYVNIIKTETIYSKVRNKTRLSTLSTPIQHSIGIPSQSNKTGRRHKRNTHR
jgi:hypothetical protein